MRQFAALILLCLALGLGSQALAQAPETPNFEAWEQLATRAEAAIESGEVSTEALDALRAEIAAARARFLEAESANRSRIDTLRNQIEALGPAPAEGETEAAEIAARRTELTERLAAIEAPRRTATEAFSRAQGLIDELDGVIRDRQTDRLLQLGPSPVNPANWPGALTYLTDYLHGVQREVAQAWASPATRADARERLPATLLLLVIGLALLVRGRVWMKRATAAVQRGSSEVGRVALGFLVSLGQVVLPVLGLLALSNAVLSTGLAGLRGTALLEVVPLVGFFTYAALWLGSRIFPPAEAVAVPLDLPVNTRAEGRGYTALLGLLIGLSLIFTAIFDNDRSDDASIAVLSFPFILLLGLLLFRLGRFLTRAMPSEDADGESGGLKARGGRILGRATMLIGVSAPVMAAVGYTNLAVAMSFPAAMSLALIAALVIVNLPIRDIYALISGRKPEDARDALVPVLISFALSLAALPLFALIWGTRPAELGELWARFLAGVTLGETRISPIDFLTVIIVFLIGYALTRFIQSTLRTNVLPKTKLDIGGRNAIVSGVGYVGLFLAALISITAAGINLSNLAIFASALAVGVGFGLQNIVSNFVSGIILLIERPISEGDWIEVGGQMGYVRDISVRSTRIETFDRSDVIVPNADLVSGMVINYTRGNLTGRAIVPVGVAYGTDTRKVEAILREIAEAHPLVAMTPPPNVLFRGFGADSLDFEIRAILRDVNYVMAVKSDMNHEIAKRFTEEGIEIPFAQRDIWLRNPEALRASEEAPPAAPPEDDHPEQAPPERRPDLPGFPEEDTS